MKCISCPRECNVERPKGFCKAGENVTVSKYQLHMWEEPPISGSNGSGAIFFSGCNMRCVFCQNYKISRTDLGKEMNANQLSDIFLELMEQGAHNINLVTPSHFTNQIAQAIKISKLNGLNIPIIYNSSGYDKLDSLRKLEGLIDVYLPDIKYFSSEPAKKYSSASDYFSVASAAALEMHRQVGEAVFDQYGLITRGIIIRHLVLPSLRNDSKKIIDWIKQNIPNAYVSIMSQYFPEHEAVSFKELNRRITSFEYASVVNHFSNVGLLNGFVQERQSAVKDFVPEF